MAGAVKWSTIGAVLLLAMAPASAFGFFKHHRYPQVAVIVNPTVAAAPGGYGMMPTYGAGCYGSYGSYGAGCYGSYGAGCYGSYGAGGCYGSAPPPGCQPPGSGKKT